MAKKFHVHSGQLDIEVSAKSHLEAAMRAFRSVRSAKVGVMIMIDTPGERTRYVQTEALLLQMKRDRNFSFELDGPDSRVVSALGFNSRWGTRLAALVVGLSFWGHLVQNYSIAMDTALFSRSGLGYATGFLGILATIYFLTSETADDVVRSSIAYVTWFLAALVFVIVG